MKCKAMFIVTLFPWVAFSQEEMSDDDYFGCGLQENIYVRGDVRSNFISLPDSLGNSPIKVLKDEEGKPIRIHLFGNFINLNGEKEMVFVDFSYDGSVVFSIINETKKFATTTQSSALLRKPVSRWKDSYVVSRHYRWGLRDHGHGIDFGCTRATKKVAEEFLSPESHW